MVYFKDLANKKGEREIRELVFAKGETIKVFEPDMDDIEKILEIQERFIDSENPENINLDGEEVIELFKILTDIKGLDDLTEEEIEEVIDNPSIALLNTQNVVEGIVTEIYKMVILSIKNRILETDLNIQSAKTSDELMERTLDMARRDNTAKEHAKKVDEAAEKVAKLHAAREEAEGEATKSTEETDKKPAEPTKQIGKHANVLAQYRQSFGEESE